jgi:hypothetical protein
LALTALDHPLALDRTSPLHTDFRKKDWNRIYRNVAPVKKVRTAHKSSAPPLQPALVEALATLSSEGP